MLDSVIANQIEALPAQMFHDLARHCVDRLGYGRPTTSDGWADGGRDIRVHRVGSLTPLDVAIQTSVEREWKQKLLDDLKKAQKKLGCHTFIYVTNRRIPDAEFRPLVLTALTNGVNLSKIDKQDIGQQISGDGELFSWFTDYMGYPCSHKQQEPSSLREEVSAADVLFSDDAREFRAKIIERAVLVQLAHEDELSRGKLVVKAMSLVSVSGLQARWFEAAIDRLQQRRQILYHRKTKTYSLSPDAKQRHRDMQRTVAYEWEQFLKSVAKVLESYLPRKVDKSKASEMVAAQMGVIIHSYRDYQAGLLGPASIDPTIQKRYAKEVQAVKVLLHQEGVPLHKVPDCIRKLADLESQHPVVARLSAGEVFRKLLPANRSVLLNALSRSKSLTVYLEPSVMIPLLCSKLYAHAHDKYALSGLILFQTALAMNFSVYLPDVYLEECATHLVIAGRYERIVKSAPLESLRYFENAFVAYYASLNDSSISFDAFLRSFGYKEPTFDFTRHRHSIAITLERLIGQYEIKVSPVSRERVSQHVRRAAQEDLMHIYHELNIDKSPLLQQHDIAVLQFLRSQSLKKRDAEMLVTWDKAMIVACQQDEYGWWCLDPIHASDLFSLVAPDSHSTIGVEVSLYLEETVLRRAALIWDTLVKIERDRLRDAELFAKATAFKDAYLSKQADNAFMATRIKAAWKSWKEEVDEKLASQNS